MTQRVAAIYDIHGNLPALEAVLEEIRRAGVDQIVVGGDVVPGPMPRETLARLLDLDVPVQLIHGNGDREVLAARRGTETATLPEQAREAIRWTAQQLDPEHEKWMASWPPTLRLKIRGLGPVLFCHATPRNDTEIFTRQTAEDCLLPVFEGLDVSMVVCGHTHMPFDRVNDLARFVAFAMGDDMPQVLKKETLEESFQRLVTVNPAFRRGYGIGFQVLRIGEVVLHGHSGGLAGYQGEVYFDRNSRIGVIILRNAVGGSFSTTSLLRAAFEAPPADK